MRGLTHSLVVTALLSACAPHADERSRLAQGASDSPQLRAVVSARDTVTVCVLQDREVRSVRAEVDPVSGDPVLEGYPSARTYPNVAAPHADEAEWFVRQDPIVFQRRTYVWNGPRLAFSPDAVKRVGELGGIPLFALREEVPGDIGMLLVPVRPGCEFQPYYYFDESGPVRGE